MKTRTHFTFRVDTWTPDGESIVEHVAAIEDYQVALATYRAACERCRLPWALGRPHRSDCSEGTPMLTVAPHSTAVRFV